MDINQEAWFIYSIVKSQYIMGAGGPVGINQGAIHRAMELYNIQNKKDCFEKVLVLSAHTLNRELETWKRQHAKPQKYSHRLHSFKN